MCTPLDPVSIFHYLQFFSYVQDENLPRSTFFVSMSGKIEVSLWLLLAFGPLGVRVLDLFEEDCRVWIFELLL